MKIIRHKPERRPVYWPDTPVRPPVKRALLVGIEYRQDELDGQDNLQLRGPHKDVFAMRQLLIDRYSYHQEDVVVLVDTEHTQVQPTRDNLIQAIKNLVDGALPGDKFFFHYAGHAAQVQNSHFSEEDGMDEYIIPSDGENGLIKDNELRRYLVDPLPIGANLVAVFDSCHSATLLDLEHLRCNQVYVPWISKGKRKSDSRMNANVRREAMVMSRHIYQNKRISHDNIISRRTSVEQMAFPSPDYKKISIRTRSASIKSELEVWYDTPLSPIRRTTSPDSMWPCTGYCQPELPAEANVIALSACKDDQLSWEDVDGSSMTMALVEILKSDPHPRLVHLLRDISHKLHGFYLRLHNDARAHRKRIREVNKLRVAKGLAPRPIPEPPEMDNFQDPQVSSHRPVSRNAVWDP